jgi:AraC-like DNA-binding protein
MISPRTLQRRLGDYHLSYQSLLNGLREQLACRYPLQSSLSFVEIALLVGISEQSAFNRAFKNGTGARRGDIKKHTKLLTIRGDEHHP